MGYSIEYTYFGTPMGPSDNTSYTRFNESLRGLVFEDRALAEEEATKQQSAMGSNYEYFVVSTGFSTVPRTAVYNAITLEDNYAQAWSKGRKSIDGSVPDHMVSRQTGHAFSQMEWIIFAEKYLAEAKTAYANFLPDMNVVNIRLLKAASLLVSALQCSATQSDLDKIAGVSSTTFPIQHGGLSAFKQYAKDNPTFTGDKA
jgi:hypothetical protein